MFFALWPDDTLRAALHRHAQQCCARTGGRAVAAAKLHMTLVFLGAVPRPRIAALSALAAQCAARLSAPFAFRLEQTVFRARQRMVWALPESVPAPLAQLVADLERALRAEAFTLEDRAWRAHVTLVRNAAKRADLPPLEQQWTARDFALVESVSGEYRVLARWPDAGGA